MMRVALALLAIALAPTAAAAQQGKSDCRILRALADPALLQTLSFKVSGTGRVALLLPRGARFSRDAESCDLDANDTLNIDCDWRFETKEEAVRFYEDMLALSRSCLGFPLPDKAVIVDPKDGNDWNVVRRAEEADFDLELVEYQGRNYVSLNVYPADLAATRAESGQ